jgi:hypothetical protein
MKKSDIGEMSLDEIIAFIGSKKDSLPTEELFGCLRRLSEIIVLDNRIPEQQREMALKLYCAIMQYLKESSDNPDALKALKDANDGMIKNACNGSLSWKINEESIPSEDVVAYAMRPDHRHLVPDFLATTEIEELKKIKREFIRQIILSEDYDGMNAVLMMHGLTAKGDKAVAALLSPVEFNALLNVPTDYTSGRNVLVSFGLLPKESGERPFKPISDITRLVTIILNCRKEDDEKDARLEKLSKEEKSVLLIALFFLRIVLAHCHLQQIYGKETADQGAEIFKSPAVNKLISKVQKVARKKKPGASIDLIMLVQILSWRNGRDATTEEECQKLQPYLNMASDWLNHERVSFQYYFRFMLRTAGDPIFREECMNFEDWIGTH